MYPVVNADRFQPLYKLDLCSNQILKWFTVYAVSTQQKSTLFNLYVTPNVLTTVMALFTLTITHN